MAWASSTTYNATWVARFAGRRVLLLGAGGAAHGALLPFLEQEPTGYSSIENRTVAKARLGAHFSAFGNLRPAGYSDLGGPAVRPRRQCDVCEPPR